MGDLLRLNHLRIPQWIPCVVERSLILATAHRLALSQIDTSHGELIAAIAAVANRLHELLNT